MASAYFSHPDLGTLTTENGIDGAEWAYGLNTQSYPTYGGEVVQILSVYIDDVTISGSCSTYTQLEAIYHYFSSYMQIATQGRTGTPNPDRGTSYNLTPITFTYPEREWHFSIYPKALPGFGYGSETIFGIWQITANIRDDSNELTDIKKAIQDQAVAQQMGEFQNLNDKISPDSGDPNTDPFQTFTQGTAAAESAIGSYSDFFSSLVSGYQNGDFVSLTGGQGSSPTDTSRSRASGQSVTAPANTDARARQVRANNPNSDGS